MRKGFFMKRKFFKLIGIFLLTILLIASLAAPLGCVQKASKEYLESKLTDSVNSTFKQIEEANAELEQSYPEGFSTDCTITFSDVSLGDEQLNEILINLQIIFGLSTTKDESLIGVEVSYNNEEPVSIVALSSLVDKMTVISSSLFRDTYSFTFEDLSENTDLDYTSLPTEPINPEEARTVANHLMGIVFLHMTEENLTIERNAEVTVFEEAMNADTYTIYFTAEDYKAILNDMLDYLSTDETAKKVGNALYPFFNGFSSSNDVTWDPNSPYTEAKPKPAANYEEALTKAKAKVDETAEYLAEDDATFRFAISKGKIVLFELVETDDDDSTNLLRVEIASDSQKTQWRLTIDGEEEGTLDFIDNKSGTKHEGSFTVNMKQDEIIKVEFSYDEAQKSKQGLCFGNYKLTLDIDGDTLTADAEVKAGTNGTDIIVEVSVPTKDISFTMNIAISDAPTKFEAPTGTPKDFSSLSDKELNDLTTEVMFKLLSISWIRDLFMPSGE
jgi:hypothetical protein